MDLKNLLRDYVYDTNNPDLCFKIGTHYRNIKQYASAITFFLRASELFTDSNSIYNSILNMALCFRDQTRRRFSYKNMLLKSMSIDPTRPETYYLLAEWYETEDDDGKYFDSYSMITNALRVYDEKEYLIPITKEEMLYKKASYAHMCNMFTESKEILEGLLQKELNTDLKRLILLKLMEIKVKLESQKRNETKFSEVHKNGLVSYALKNGGTIKALPLPINAFPNMKTITNPSVAIVNDKILVNARCTNYILYYSNRCPTEHGPVDYLSPESDRSLKSENILFELDSDLNELSAKPVDMKLNKKPNWHFIGLEDARLIQWEDQVYLCGVRRDELGEGKGRMNVSKLKITETDVKETERFNMPAPGLDASYCEKNWMPIVDQPFQFVKWTNPTEVVSYKNKKTETIVLDETKRYDFPRDPRGGSQVLKWNDDFYVAITHESIYNSTDNGRKYMQRIVVWDKDWNVVNWTQDFTMMSGQIEFVSGMAFHNDEVYITFGYEDNSAFILKMDRKSFDDFVIGG
jgi:tetratricopeptide (TPR) repeat protein